MGARIHGVGSSTLFIEGVLSLHDSIFTVTGDRIVAGTYLCAAMARGGLCDHDGNPAIPYGGGAALCGGDGSRIQRYDDRISVTMTGRRQSIRL